jgi:hypothetical protein
MRKVLLILAALASLTGCATNQSYGNYSAAPAAYDRTMASDTVEHLVRIYPPALTRWNIMQPAEDAFGSALIALMRSHGYSVKEYVPEGEKKSQPAVQAALAPGVELRYVVDSLKPTLDLYRVTVIVAGQPISRAYVPQKNGTVTAAGSWARKE